MSYMSFTFISVESGELTFVVEMWLFTLILNIKYVTSTMKKTVHLLDTFINNIISNTSQYLGYFRFMYSNEKMLCIWPSVSKLM